MSFSTSIIGKWYSPPWNDACTWYVPIGKKFPLLSRPSQVTVCGPALAATPRRERLVGEVGSKLTPSMLITML